MSPDHGLDSFGLLFGTLIHFNSLINPWIMCLFSIKDGPAKIERKRVKKSIFIDIMHDMDVKNDAKMNNNHVKIVYRSSGCRQPIERYPKK